MFKSTFILLTLFLVEECFSAGDITMKDVQLVSKKFGKSCEHTSTRVTCSVKGGENINLTATWGVDGTDAALGLVLLRVSLKYSDGDGDHNNISVCQRTGGHFEFVENPCSIFIVATGDYGMEPYRFRLPHSRSKKSVRLSIWVYTEWSDGTSSTKRVGEMDLIFKKKIVDGC